MTAVLPTSFLAILTSYGSNTMWENLALDGDGEWICKGIAAGYLCIAHVGSYMAKVSTSLCSAGIIIYRRTT